MKRLLLLLIVLLVALPVFAQGGPGTKDFPIRDFGACINLPDFAAVTEPDAYNSLYTVPGLFEINFAEYLMPVAAMPATGDDIYNAMIALLNTVSASDYARIPFDHPQYVSAAVEFTLDGQRMFGMIYRNQDDKLFFLFADKVEGFDMLAIGRAIFAADADCQPLPGFEYPQAAAPPVDLTSWPIPPVPSANAVEKHGNFYSDTWSGEIYVTGDLRGERLTIEPGTIIWVAAHSDVGNLNSWEGSLQIGVNTGITGINGVEPGEPFRDEANHTSINITYLDAVGTPEQPIIITSASPTPALGDWNMFRFENGHLEYAIAEYYRMLQGGAGAEIRHNLLRYGLEFLVSSNISTSNATATSSTVIENNRLMFAGHELIYISPNSAPIIRNNELGPNPFDYGWGQPPNGGICIAQNIGATPIIEGNTLAGCHVGVQFVQMPAPNLDQNWLLTHNTFSGNGTDFLTETPH